MGKMAWRTKELERARVISKRSKIFWGGVKTWN